MQDLSSRSITLEEATIPKLPNLNRSTVAGISVAIAGNILISIALNCQKLAHGRLERDRELARGQSKKDQRDGAAKSSRNGIATLITEEEDVEDYGTDNAGQDYVNGEIDHPEELPTMAVLETQPLLARSDASNDAHALNSSRPTRTVSILGRFNPWARKHTHNQSQSAHSLVPVDVVTVRPGNVTDQEQSGTGQGNDGNESDYLRSKLWSV